MKAIYSTAGAVLVAVAGAATVVVAIVRALDDDPLDGDDRCHDPLTTYRGGLS